MKEWLNPFDILGATPRDDRRRLAMLAQDAALLVDEKEAQAAYTALILPLIWVLNRSNIKHIE